MTTGRINQVTKPTSNDAFLHTLYTLIRYPSPHTSQGGSFILSTQFSPIAGTASVRYHYNTASGVVRLRVFTKQVGKHD